MIGFAFGQVYEQCVAPWHSAAVMGIGYYKRELEIQGYKRDGILPPHVPSSSVITYH